jgi:hypothetical protein
MGLAGWLFADLLLALSVVFLVAQDRPSQETDKDAQIAELEKTVAEKNSEIDKLQNRNQELEEICDANGCAKASGLNPGEQLLIEMPNGASRVMSVAQMTVAVDGAELNIEKGVADKESVPITWKQLKSDNKRIGFVIFFTKDINSAKKIAEANLGTFIEVLARKGLVDKELQLEKDPMGKYRFDVFPSLTRYEEKELPTAQTLKIRALMFTYTAPSSSTTTTVAD